MAKKKSTGKKIEDRSVRSNMNAFIGICSCVVLILAIVLFVINLILDLVNGEAYGKVIGALNLIKDIALGLVVTLSAYYFARSKKTEFKVVIYVCIGIYWVMMILGHAISLG